MAMGGEMSVARPLLAVVVLLAALSGPAAGLRTPRPLPTARQAVAEQAQAPWVPADGAPLADRRGLLQRTVATTAAAAAALAAPLPGLEPLPVHAAAPPVVVVVGARGRTGKLVQDYLLAKGATVISGTRDGSVVGDATRGVAADVTNLSTLEAAVKGADAVIFCASASKKGGNAKQVDNVGVQNIASACVSQKVPRLVVVSSAAVSKPDSVGYKVTNLFGGIMTQKYEGEQALRSVYASTPELHYTIVRPGGLKDGPPEGPAALELNQGDDFIGEVTRADVAAAAAEASINYADDVTFELYSIKTRSPTLSKQRPPTGLEKRAETWPALLEGLKPDAKL
mmetsp:Transcript_17837/g.60626  ORF Transcript_17837/g.60626 Transcript_17837/m.60626 type:complete len:340 (-) Transcript_17837:87-1106(-)